MLDNGGNKLNKSYTLEIDSNDYKKIKSEDNFENNMHDLIHEDFMERMTFVWEEVIN